MIPPHRRIHWKAVRCLAVACLFPGLARADAGTLIKETAQDGAFLYTSPLRLTKDDLPAGALVLGALGGGVALDRIARHNLISSQNDPSAKTLRRYGDIAQFAGPILGGAFALDGWIREDDSEKRASWELIESFLWANALSYTFKVALGRRRPNATDDPFEFRPGKTSGSFPSGHTTSVFAAATTISDAYPTWKVAVPAYAAATAVAFSRIYANQHWASDVVAGALLGSGVSHALWKRHRRGSQDAWNLEIQGNGVALSKRFGHAGTGLRR